MKTMVLAVALLSPIRSNVKGVVRVPVDLHSGSPIVSVMIDGKGPYRFKVDTSVKYALIIDKSIANHAQKTTRVERLSLGDAQFEGAVAVIDDVRAAQNVDGIIGFGLFGHVIATLDFANAELRISHGALQPDVASVLPLKLFDGVPSVIVGAGDQYLFASINTETPGALTVPKKLAIGETTNLRVGTVKLPGARVASIDNSALPKIGTDFLANAVVTFDAAHGRVAVEPAVRQ